MVGNNPSVLIVDDEPAVCDLLQQELSERGCHCGAAVDGKDALSKLASHHFDVVLLDVRLPRMSGMELLKTIRMAHPDTVAVMITAINKLNVAVEAMKLGASDYIVKPFDLAKVYTSIRMALKARQDSSGRTDDETAISLQREETEPPAGKSIRYIDAIARGAEAKLDELVGYSLMVNRMTVEVARQLHIPEKQIQRWSAVRSEHGAKRDAAIRSLLSKLEQNPLAHYIMGMAVPYVHMPKTDKSQN